MRHHLSVHCSHNRGPKISLPAYFACLLRRLMACFAARLVPINAPGFHEDARNTSTTRSSMSLTTMVYCLGVLSPGPRTVTLGGGPDHCAPTPIPDARIRSG